MFLVPVCVLLASLFASNPRVRPELGHLRYCRKQLGAGKTHANPDPGQGGPDGPSLKGQVSSPSPSPLGGGEGAKENSYSGAKVGRLLGGHLTRLKLPSNTVYPVPPAPQVGLSTPSRTFNPLKPRGGAFKPLQGPKHSLVC